MTNKLVFHFEPYVFKNKEYIFCKKDINNIIADILIYKTKNSQINAKLLQKNIFKRFFTQKIDNFMKNSGEKYVFRKNYSDFKYYNFIFELNKKYNNLFDFNYLMISKKIDKNIIIDACKNIVEMGSQIGIVFAERSRMKNVITAQGKSVKNFDVFDTYNLLNDSPTKVRRKYNIKSRCGVPKINDIEIYGNYRTCDVIRVCYRSKIEYKNMFNQCLVRVHFGNVKFACQSAVVQRLNLFDMFENFNIKFNNVFDCYNIKFADNRVQRIYDELVQVDTLQICADLDKLLSHDAHSTAYKYFIREIVGLCKKANSLAIRPNTRLIGCDFVVQDLNIRVKKVDKAGYILDEKIFSTSIPINYEDIAKLDCILY